LDTFISPLLLFIGCALGAAGVALALPKQKVAPFVIGAIVGGAGLGVVLIGLGLAAVKLPGGAKHLPNVFFYLFSGLALLSALRVITHQRPLYAALWFILTIVASCGLYTILSAEFMAFALVIVYGGAILITYMFVIMLASEGDTEDATEGTAEYDRVAREPVVATIAGFVLLGALTVLLAQGMGGGSGGAGGGLKADPALAASDSPLKMMPQKVEASLRRAGLMSEGERLGVVDLPASKGRPLAKLVDITMAQGDTPGRVVIISDSGASRRELTSDKWPEDLRLANVERVAFELIDRNPAAVEIAGVILLMAMLGAVVLARRKIEMDELSKQQAQARMRESADFGRRGAFVPPAVGGNT
jgi:NADH-quinone oxidoreductase subunit J